MEGATPLVYIALAVRQVLQVLYRLTAEVGHPAGTAEVVAVDKIDVIFGRLHSLHVSHYSQGV